MILVVLEESLFFTFRYNPALTVSGLREITIILNEHIRNIAIIAHVDHGKTTLVDAFLKQSHIFRDNQIEMSQEMILDSNELEREKGITILAKNIAIMYKEYKINIIDTPGHADFGGEVERTLTMADGCLLLVDAQEGTMPQTKFVLKKALELGLKPIVVINKIDKKFANAKKALDKVNDLFLQLATDMSQLDFPVFYAIGREGKVWNEMPEGDLTIANSIQGDIRPLLDGIVESIPAPTTEEGTFQMQIASIEQDSHQGKFLVGKIKRGKVKIGDSVVVLLKDQKVSGKVKTIRTREGLGFKYFDEASSGDIVGIAGIDINAIGGTLTAASNPEKMSEIKISNPSVQIRFEANTSPFMGKEGKYVSSKQLQERLDREAEGNISLKISKLDGGAYTVAGRGELQLSILIETMRREGYEFQVRRPEVIIQEIEGKKFEPLEELYIEVPTEYQGTVTQALSERKAELLTLEMDDSSNQAKFMYKILTRNLLGLRTKLLTETKGNLIINNFLLDYVPYTHQEEMFRRGVLLASEGGTAMGYSLNTIQDRGELIIEPGTQVYEGMIIGIHKYENDLEVNVIKERQKSAVRMKHDEITQTSLKSIKTLTLEFALLFLNKDEILEITPQNLRLRKQHLTKTQRDWARRDNLNDYAKAALGVK